MKEKPKGLTLDSKKVPAAIAQAEASSAPAESLSELDKCLVDNTKLKRELALERVKNALSQSENVELLHNNIILQLAMKYKLKEGDIISEDGTIKRT